MPRPLPEALFARDEEFPDFATREIRYIDRDHIKRLKLLLPASPTMDRFLASRTKLAEAKEKRYVWATGARRDAERQVRSRQVHPSSPSAVSRKPDKDRGATEREELRWRFDAERVATDCAQTPYGTRVQVYRWDEPLKLIERQANPDRSMVERDSALFEQLKKLGAFRAVASPAALDQTLDALKRLRSQQPHFAGVIELIEGWIRLAREMAVPPHLPPILLVGPPGVGKTHFTLQLTEALGRPIHRLT
jgi:flagellar biosynthesis GTPase FlhF